MYSNSALIQVDHEQWRHVSSTGNTEFTNIAFEPEQDSQNSMSHKALVIFEQILVVE